MEQRKQLRALRRRLLQDYHSLGKFGCLGHHSLESLGPESLGAGNLGPGSLGPGNLGPGNLGPAKLGKRRLGLMQPL
jgi:hypothetical protein